ncbi:putative membrane protein [Hyphomicrobiales bacterium]|nr:putative membrane protein [Hyphomicrobiales bacterium]CAH1679148.1 putative membrane protein [Hyphomicrobiales bacterium]
MLMARILGSFTLTLIAGLVLGAAVHILTIFAIPHLAERNAYARFGTDTGASDLLFPNPAKHPPLPQPDPAVAVAACSFDLSKGPVVASARLDASFASLSIHARGGQVLYALTDQAATRGQVKLTLMSQAYFDEFVADSEEATATNTLRLVTSENSGLVVIRVLAAFPSEMPEAKKAAESLLCMPQPQAPRS